MKVIIVEPWAQRLGGAETMLWTLLRHLDRERINPIVVFLETGTFEREVASLGIRTIVLPAGRLRQLNNFARTVLSLLELYRGERPDLVLNWTAKVHLYSGTAAMLAGLRERVVWWQHGIPQDHWMDHLATRIPSKAIGCSSMCSAKAQQRLRPRRDTFVVHPGLDDQDITPDDMGVAQAKELFLTEGCSVVGVVGRLQPWKAQDRLLRLVNSLRNRQLAVHGLIVGGNAFDLSPGYELYLHRLAEDIGVKDAVTFTGQVATAAPYIRLMDVFVNTSVGEPFGIVLLEAMAAGVPVVAFDDAGPREIIEHGVTGLLVPPGNERLLADAVELLVSDQQFRRTLAANALRRFRERFTAQQMIKNLDRHILRFADRSL